MEKSHKNAVGILEENVSRAVCIEYYFWVLNVFVVRKTVKVSLIVLSQIRKPFYPFSTCK